LHRVRYKIVIIIITRTLSIVISVLKVIQIWLYVSVIISALVLKFVYVYRPIWSPHYSKDMLLLERTQHRFK